MSANCMINFRSLAPVLFTFRQMINRAKMIHQEISLTGKISAENFYEFMLPHECHRQIVHKRDSNYCYWLLNIAQKAFASQITFPSSGDFYDRLFIFAYLTHTLRHAIFHLPYEKFSLHFPREFVFFSKVSWRFSELSGP